MLRTLEFLQLRLHAVMIHNFFKIPLVLISVVNRYCNPLAAKPTSSPNSVDVALRVSACLSLCRGEDRNVEVNDNFDLRNVNAPRKHVCGDDHIDFALAEFSHDLLSFLIAHVSEHDR